MISFEMEDKPNAQSITNDQFQAIYAIALQDWSRNYIITEAQETGGDYFLIVEKERDGDSVTETYFRVEFDGDWGILYEVKPKTTETVTFEWSTEKGRCIDCGLPAAYRQLFTSYNGGDLLLCSVDAAYHAAYGDKIEYLFEEEEEP